MNLSSVYKSTSPHWDTPADLYAKLHKEFKFTFDPCPLNADFDGLARSWKGQRVFCNPPYDSESIRRFILKGTESDLAVYLLPAKTDSAWFHDFVLSYAEIRWLRGRQKYNGKSGCPFPSMVCIYRYKRIR